MAAYLVDYQTDLGVDLYEVVVYTTARSQIDRTRIDIDESNLLPDVFRQAVKTRLRGQGCRLDLTPRRVIAYLSNQLLLEIPLPFRGVTPQHQQFLDQLRANPLILAFDLLPEAIGPYLLSVYLNRA